MSYDLTTFQASRLRLFFFFCHLSSLAVSLPILYAWHKQGQVSCISCGYFANARSTVPQWSHANGCLVAVSPRVLREWDVEPVGPDFGRVHTATNSNLVGLPFAEHGPVRIPALQRFVSDTETVRDLFQVEVGILGEYRPCWVASNDTRFACHN